MKLDLTIIKDNEVCMKHRPTEVSVLGAGDKVEEAERKVLQIKTTLLPTTEGGLAQLTRGLKNVVVGAKKAVKQAMALADKAIVAKAMSLPTLSECLETRGCGIFLQCLEKANMADIKGCTILAPKDDAFLGEGVEGFEEECFDVHIIDGPYNDIYEWPYHKFPELLGYGKGFLIDNEQVCYDSFSLGFNDPTQFYLFNVCVDPYDFSDF